MKILLYLVSFLLTATTIFGQSKTYSVEELGWHGLTLNHLDSIYYNGIPGSDPRYQVFSQKYFENVVAKARIDLLQKIGDYFKKNNLKWGTEVKCWTRMYFNTDGTIEYFVYHFISKVDNNKEDNFKRLLDSFIKINKFSVIAKQKFSLCGGVTWTD
jgi:hypothetical protein